MNLKPFQTFEIFLSNQRNTWYQIIGNILVFFPLTIYFQLIFKKKPFITFLMIFAIGFCVEVIQLITHRGVFDIDDLLLYTVGILLGLLCMFILNKWFQGNNNEMLFFIMLTSDLLVAPLILTMVEELLYLPLIQYAWISFVTLFIYDISLYFCFKKETSSRKKLYYIMTILILVLYYIVALPNVAPHLI